MRKQIEAKDLLGYPAVYDVGMRQVTSLSKPVLTLADYPGFRIRVPKAKISVDLFATLGATPVPLDGTEIYTGLQTHLVDGQESPLATIESFKLYEVQKFISMTNHMWSAYWLIANPAAIAALPANIRPVVVRNNQKSALLERKDIAAMNDGLKSKLESQGMTFHTVDVAPLRAKLRPYYARLRADFGETAWNLLEKTSGKLT